MKEVPAGAWDCHVHVFGPAARFPYAAERRYTPADALPDSLQQLMKRLGMARAVLVQPSPYADDHRCLLEALRVLGGSAVGVAAMADALDPAIIGCPSILGLRLNLHTMDDVGEIRRRIAAGAQAARAHGWHLELHVTGRLLPGLALESLPVDFVLDHMARLESTQGPSARTLLALLEAGRCWVKLSGAERVGGHAPDIARRLLDARPDRLLWGSDWPHTPLDGALAEPRTVDTAGFLRTLVEWSDSSAALERVLVHNPTRLYGRRAC